MKHTAGLPRVLAAAVVLVVACGGSGAPAATDSPSIPEPSEAPSTTLTVSTDTTPPTVAQVPEESATGSLPPIQEGSPQPQRLLAVTLDGNGTATVPVTDEGAGFGVVAIAEPGDVTDFELHDETGSLIPPLMISPIEIFETPGSLAAEYPSGGSGGQLTVIGAAGAAVGLSFSVVSPVVAAVTATPLDDGTVEIVVTLTGPDPLAEDQTVHAYLREARDDAIEIPFAERGPGVLTYRSVVQPPGGDGPQFVDVEISGTYTRWVSTGFVIGDSSRSG